MSDTIKSVCTVEVLVQIDSSWGVTQTMEKILNDAASEARAVVEKMMHDATCSDQDLKTVRLHPSQFRLAGIKKITTQLVQDR